MKCDIKLAHVKFNGNNFDMFVYKIKIILAIKYFWLIDGKLTTQKNNKSFRVLFKKKLDNKDIYMLDIGANIGWFTYFFDEYGYKIISFEASKINNYILYKNYCINNEINVVIINKGLDKKNKYINW